MMKSEVKIYDSNINLRPRDAENVKQANNSQFSAIEVIPQFEEVKEKCDLRFGRKRKFRRVKSAGIF